MNRVTVLTKPNTGSWISCVRWPGIHKLIISHIILTSYTYMYTYNALTSSIWLYMYYEYIYMDIVCLQQWCRDMHVYGMDIHMCCVCISMCLQCVPVCFYIINVSMYTLYRDTVNKHVYPHKAHTHACLRTYIMFPDTWSVIHPRNSRWRIYQAEYRPFLNCVILGKSVDSFGFTFFFVWLERDQL